LYFQTANFLIAGSFLLEDIGGIWEAPGRYLQALGRLQLAPDGDCRLCGWWLQALWLIWLRRHILELTFGGFGLTFDVFGVTLDGFWLTLDVPGVTLNAFCFILDAPGRHFDAFVLHLGCLGGRLEALGEHLGAYWVDFGQPWASKSHPKWSRIVFGLLSENH
jgi:hypothetical protein